MSQELLNAIQALIALIITGFIIPWIVGKLGEQKFDKIKRVTERAVKAAEQIYGAGKGEEKNIYVLKYLRSLGMTLENTELQVIVESAVKEYCNKK